MAAFDHPAQRATLADEVLLADELLERLRTHARCGPLAVRASAEYAYVRRDIRRIVRVAILMLAIVAVLYVLINVLRVIQV